MIGKDKVLDKIGAEMIKEGMGTHKILVETTAEIDAG